MKPLRRAPSAVWRAWLRLLAAIEGPEIEHSFEPRRRERCRGRWL